LDALLRGEFRTRLGRVLRVAAFGIDFGGNHGAQVLAFCRVRKGRRIFACKGIAGPRPIWPGRATRSKQNDPLYLIGVDTAKDAIYSRLLIDPPEPGTRKPGFIHFPVGENFGPEYFDQLNAERRQVHKRMGQPVVRWVPIRERNEALDTFVGALAMRKGLPRYIEAGLEYSTLPPVPREDVLGPVADDPLTDEIEIAQAVRPAVAPTRHSGITRAQWLRPHQAWINRR
jgi:phage terminase large subunit GpA-like protein